MMASSAAEAVTEMVVVDTSAAEDRVGSLGLAMVANLPFGNGAVEADRTCFVAVVEDTIDRSEVVAVAIVRYMVVD